MKILIYRWSVFHQEDIAEAFESFGHTVEYYEEMPDERKGTDIRRLKEVVAEYDLVFSANYFSRVSNACQAQQKKYIAWTVDSPMLTMFDTSVFNECNYIFLFDKFDYYRFLQMGVKHVYYLPLAVNAERVKNCIEAASEKEKGKYRGDISFVGGLYYKNSYDAIEDKLPEYLQGYFDACMEAQLDLYGDNVFDRLLTADILERLCEIIDFHQSDTAFSDIRLVFSSTYLGFKTAQKERIRNLNALASRFKVNLYTDRTDDRLHGVHVRESVDYREEMPLVFHESDINMNFTIRNIRTGLPLRIWDILGAGGFLLTNYQIELGDFFENGKDLVYYDSLDDMMRKAEYYLDHEDERKTIAQNGLKKIVQYHTYEHRIDVILKTVL